MFGFLSNDLRPFSFLDGVPTALSNPSKPNSKSLAQCLGFYPMTLQAISAGLTSSTAYGDSVEPSKDQQRVIGTMFWFLPKNVTQRAHSF
jgi:hypothetical protein